MNEKTIDVKETIIAIVCAVVYTLVKFGLFAIAYWLFTADMGLDIRMNPVKAIAIAYAICMVLFSLFRGV